MKDIPSFIFKIIMKNILIIIFLFFVACSASQTRVFLDKADEIMETNPDSALNILEKINIGELKDGKEKAKYALLLTQAQVKNHQIITNDSLINIAYQYYSSHGNDFDKMRAFFYTGKIHYNIGDYAKGIIDAMKAYELSLKLKNDYWRAKTAELLGDIYSITYHHIESQSMRSEAAIYYHKAGKYENHFFSLLDKAVSFINQNELDKGIQTIDSIILLTRDSSYFQNIYFYGMESLMSVYYFKNDLQKSDSINDILVKFNGNPVSYLYFINQSAKIKIRNKKYKEAEELINISEKLTSDKKNQIDLLNTKELMAISKGDYRKAYEYKDSIQIFSNELLRENLKESPIIAQREYVTRNAIEEKQKKVLTEWILAESILVFIIILSFIYYVYKTRIKTKITEMENLITDFTRLRNDNNKIINQLFKNQHNTFNLICDKFYDRYGDEKFNKRILSELYEEIEKLGDRNNLKEIEDSVNRYLDNIIVKLKEECPFLKPEDITFMTLLFAGFTSRTVCMIMNMARKTFYSKRSRIEKRILDSDAPDKELFIDLMR